MFKRYAHAPSAPSPASISTQSMSPDLKQSTVTRGLDFRGPGRYWQDSPSTSGPSQLDSKAESELVPWVRGATGSLSPQNVSYAGAVLYIRYQDTNVCPCGMVFHFTKGKPGTSARKKALKAHIQTHEGVQFWDLSALRSGSSQETHMKYLGQRYPGAAILPFEEWIVPASYKGPDNVAQSKSFFFTASVVPSPPCPSSLTSNREDEGGFPEDSLYCLCRTPYDGSRAMIWCESCNEWFHFSCVAISPDQIELVGHYGYYCPTCEHADDETRA